MKFLKYMVIAINYGSDFIKTINHVSEDEPRQLLVGESSIITFTTSMLLNELNELLRNCEGMEDEDGEEVKDNFILVLFDDDTVKINMLDGLSDYFNFRNNVTDLLGNPRLEINRAENKTFFEEVEKREGRESIDVTAYLLTLDEDEKNEIKEEIIEKLPFISEWEKEYLNKS